MKIKIDLGEGTLEEETHEGVSRHVLGSPEAFRLISKAWLRSGWDAKYVHGFSWMGRPIIQLPEDMIRIQEVIYRVKPDVLIETGVAHGGSLIFYASLFKAMGKGRVVGVDVEIRPHNRTAIEAHELFGLVTLVEGSSIAPEVLSVIAAAIKEGEAVMVVLDSNHSRDHVLAELVAYSRFVSMGSYIVATDGIMQDLVGAPRSQPDWEWNNPARAALEFTSTNSAFEIEEPRFPFNEGQISERVTYWPNSYVRRVR